MSITFDQEELVLTENYKKIIREAIGKIFEASYGYYSSIKDNVPNMKSMDMALKLKTTSKDDYTITVNIDKCNEANGKMSCMIDTNGGVGYKLSTTISKINNTGYNKEEKATVSKPSKRGHKKIPDEIKEAIVSDYKTNQYTIKTLAEKYGVAPSTVHKILTESGVKKETTPIETANGEERLVKYCDQVVHDIAANEMTLQQICDKYQIKLWVLNKFISSHDALIDKEKKKICKQANGPRDWREETSFETKYQRPNADLEAQIVQDLIPGDKTNEEIAAKYGTSVAVIDSIADFNQHTIKTRRSSFNNIPKVPTEWDDSSNDEEDNDVLDEKLKKMLEKFNGKEED